MNRFFFALCLSILGSLSSVCNPPIRFIHYSTQNGLPNDYVLSIVQDANGFIWFGTHLGIVRFDGHSFSLIQPDPGKTSSLSHKHISFMFIDLRGNLWIKFTENAINRMDTQTGEFFNYLSDTTKSNSISSLRITDFFEDRDSVLWIGTRSGLNVYNNKNNDFYSVLPKLVTPDSYPSNNILSITDDTYGNIWYLSSKGIGRILRKNFETTSLSQLINRPELDSLMITSMESDRKSKLWFTTMKSGVFCYDIVAGQLTNYLQNIPNIKSLYCDKQGNIYVYAAVGNNLYYFDKQETPTGNYSKYDMFDVSEPVNYLNFSEDKTGNIWISSSHGLDMFNKNNGVIHYKHSPFQQQSISSNFLNLTFVDQTNNLWVSNYRRGVDKADLNQKPFKRNFTNPDQTDNVFLNTNITSVLEDSRNYLWIGAASNSIIRYDRKSNTLIPVKLKAYGNTMFSALFEDSEGDIWVGSYSDGISRINPNTLSVSYTNKLSEGGEGVLEKISAVRKIVEDKERNLWFATRFGISKWVRKTGKVISYSDLYDKYDPNHGFYRTVLIDRNEILWSGSYNGGLTRYDTKENKVKRYLNIPGDKTSISGNGVYVIYEESDSTFLIGTTMGLNRFNSNTEQFSIPETDKSIYNYSIYTIIPDSLDNYWMATDNGLIRLNKTTLECTFFNEGDGLPANEFNTTASCVDRDGNIYLGSPKGLLSFNPKDFTINPYDAYPTITDLQINNITITPGDTLNGRVVLTKQIWATDKLELEYYENDFALQFSAMHFSVPENNQFWYKLEGYKDAWIATDENRQWASFTGLPPGHYTFKLKATNNDGVVCKPENEASLKIIINPPFWKTLWFRILILLFIAGSIGFYFRYRIIRFKKMNTLLEKKVKERTMELHEVNSELEEQKEEINVQKESLEKVNENLRSTQEEIVTQNKELDIHRNKLEELVEARTSELQEAVKKAEESDSLKSSFLANMSHEIRTPMNAIVGFSLLLKDVDIEESRKNRYFDTIIKSSESLMVLIDDILDLSKIQSNQLTFVLQPQNINAIFHEMYRIFSIEVSKKGIPLKLNLKKIKNDFAIVSDEVRFKQVISNLLSNAIKFTREGYVEFGVYEVSDQITFYVKDTGIGIPENTGNAIFERFLKLESNINNLYRGAGLGLAISKSIVSLWEGKLWYESKESSGTTFYFTHPLDVQQSVVQLETFDDQLNPFNLKGITILIAEDEESNSDLLMAYLNKTGASILLAKNGKEACKMVDSNKVDLILMDIKMPIMGGVEASRIIRDKYPKISIIAQTAYTPGNSKDLIFNKVFDSFITKPIKTNELFRLLSKYV